MDPIRISISDLLPFLDCNFKGLLRFGTQRWVPPTDNMRLGTVLHKAAEMILQGQPPPDVEDLLMAARAAPIIKAAQEHLPQEPFRVLAVEEPLSLALRLQATPDGMAGLELVGRLDARLEGPDGALWSGQAKTLGKGQDVGLFLEKVRMSPHEIVYRSLLRAAARGRTVRGTVLWLFRTYLTKQQRADGVGIFSRHELDCDVEQDDAAFTDIHNAVEDMYYHHTAGDPPRRNWAACFTAWGACPLLRHCHFGAGWEDLLTEPLERRYEDIGVPDAS